MTSAFPPLATANRQHAGARRAHVRDQVKIGKPKSVLLAMDLGGNPARPTVGGLQVIEDVATSDAKLRDKRDHGCGSFCREGERSDACREGRTT
jgi:hypothetical protein